MPASDDEVAELARVLTRVGAAVQRERSRWPDPDRAALLRALADGGPSRAAGLAAELGLTPVAVRAQARELAGEGLVELGTDPADRRSWLIGPTAAGRAELDRLDRAGAQRFGRLVADWTGSDVRGLTVLLRRLGEAARAAGG